MKLSIPAALGIFFVAFLFMLYSAPAQAFSSEQVNRYSFAKTDDGVAVYTLTFTLGGYTKDLYIPIVGIRDLPNRTRQNNFGFEMQAGYGDSPTDDGAVVALIVAKAEIIDGQYKVPAGESVTFKIVALFKTTEDESDTYRFKVTELPFFVGDDKEAQSFNPSELKYMHSSFEALRFLRDAE